MNCHESDKTDIKKYRTAPKSKPLEDLQRRQTLNKGRLAPNLNNKRQTKQINFRING